MWKIFSYVKHDNHFNTKKKLLAKKYNIKNLSNVRSIISWQITTDIIAGIIKIN